jgi:hypothetical protein
MRIIRSSARPFKSQDFLSSGEPISVYNLRYANDVPPYNLLPLTILHSQSANVKNEHHAYADCRERS